MSTLGKNNSNTAKSERIIKFPLPTWNNPFNGLPSETLKPFCLCYQYNFNDHGYGQYGFYTQKALRVIKLIFGEIYFWDIDKFNFIICQSPNCFGAYFYYNIPYINRMENEVNQYKISLNKNRILNKNGRPSIELPPTPILLMLYDENLISSTAIDKIAKENNNFFIYNFYSTEAGDTIILFDNEIFDRVLVAAKHEQIEVVEANSIDELKPW